VPANTEHDNLICKMSSSKQCCALANHRASRYQIIRAYLQHSPAIGARIEIVGTDPLPADPQQPPSFDDLHL
ncbi:MAG: hypothetical protein ACR2IV_21365, partial [Bryobacteraceae bacterium]